MVKYLTSEPSAIQVIVQGWWPLYDGKKDTHQDIPAKSDYIQPHFKRRYNIAKFRIKNIIELKLKKVYSPEKCQSMAAAWTTLMHRNSNPYALLLLELSLYLSFKDRMVLLQINLVLIHLRALAIRLNHLLGKSTYTKTYSVK